MTAVLRQELQPNRLLPNLTAGLVNGVIGVMISTSFAALIFSGNLDRYVGAGIGMMLISAIALRSITALLSSFPGVIADTDALPSAILALMATSISNSMSTSVTQEEVFWTIFVAIALTSLLTGGFLLILGVFKFGDLIRFIPYPVIGGFLAGSGWLLMQGSIQVMTDVPLSWEKLPFFFQIDVMLRWLPGVIFGVLLFAIARRWSHFSIMPASLAAATGLFYGWLLLTNTSVAQVSAQGWLLGPFSQGNLWQPLSFSALTRVNWSAIFNQLSGATTIMVISAATILLNASGLELMAQRDINLNRELKAAGVANIVSGLGGGMVGYHVLSDSALAYKMGARSRLVGLLTAVLCAVVLVQGPTLLSFVPKFLLGGLLLFLGLLFLVEWLYDGWFKLSRIDYFVVMLILVAIATLGFLEGVGVGLVVAVAIFVINCSRIDVTRRIFSGAIYHSNVLRTSEAERLLQENGDQIYILELQGMLFFGTANKLLNEIRDRLREPKLEPVRFILLDFRLVNGIDSSAVVSFANLKRIAREQQIHLLFINLVPENVKQLQQGGCLEAEDSLCHKFPDLDRALEWCEDHILTRSQSVDSYSLTLPLQLEKALQSSEQASKLMNYLEPLHLHAGNFLFHQGDPFNGLYFVESGRVSVVLKLSDNQTKRMRSYTGGNTIGEMGLYQKAPRSASVVADQSCLLYFLSIQAFEKMEREDPLLAASFHRFIVISLAERLNHREKELRSLLH